MRRIVDETNGRCEIVALLANEFEVDDWFAMHPAYRARATIEYPDGTYITYCCKLPVFPAI